LGLVEHRHVPLAVHEFLGGAEKDVVGREDHPAGVEIIERSGGAVEEADRDFRSKLIEQGVPVFEYSAGAHN